jgi:recombination protein RecT
MSEQKNEVAEKPKQQSFSVALSESLESARGALPQGFNSERYVQNAVALLNENTTLADFAKQYGTGQIIQGLRRGAFLGIDALNKEFYLIPYKNVLNFMVDYRGHVKLAKKYSIRPIKEIYAKIVREGDLFEESIVNGNPLINFKPKSFNNGKISGAFAVCQFTDGGMDYDTMSLEDLENTRKQSKASNSPAWLKFTAEMYKKTVLHRLCKHIEIEFEQPGQKQIFEEDCAIETDQQKIAHAEIKENENTEDFEIPQEEEIETVENPKMADDNMPDFMKW